MSVRVTDDERRDRVSHPVRVCKFDGEYFQSHNQGNSPDLTDKPYEESLIGSLGEPSPEQ